MNAHSLTFEFVTNLFFRIGIVILLVGVAIVIAPQQMIRLGEILNRWVSTERFFHNLDAARPTERLFYRHHRIFGALLILGAAYVLYGFTIGMQSVPVQREFLLFHSRSATDWLLNSFKYLNILFSAVAIALGAVIFVRPSMLKTLEQRANRWYAVDDSLKRLDVQMRAPDSLFRRRPRLLGLLIVAGSLYIVVSLHLLA